MIIKDVIFPKEYTWLSEKGLAGYTESSQLQPWYYLSTSQCFWTAEKWPNVLHENLFVFAKRQDNDDLACFKVSDKGTFESVFLIHGWTTNGFEVIQQFSNFWSWLHFVLEDIKEWMESAE